MVHCLIFIKRNRKFQTAEGANNQKNFGGHQYMHFIKKIPLEDKDEVLFVKLEISDLWR